MTEKKTQNLSIYLIKEGYTHAHDVIDASGCLPPVDIPLSSDSKGSLFITKMKPAPPRWVGLFAEHLDPGDLLSSGFSGALFVEVAARRYVLSFGSGGRFLLRDDVCEERFGLICALNSIDRESFRAIDVQSLDAIQSQTRIQSGEATTSDQFGLDVEQDLLKAIVGAPSNAVLGSRMTGSDSLSVSVKMSLTDLPGLLETYRKKFEAELSSDDYEWVNNISVTKSAALIAELEAILNRKLSQKDFEGMWLSIPEIIDWNMVVGFMYTHGKKEIYPDISMTSFLNTVADGTTLSLQLLRDRKVQCADEDHQPVFRNWPVYKCLYAEIDFDSKKYILNGGKWFSIGVDFEKRTNQDFAQIPHSELTLPPYKGGGEGLYNQGIAADYPSDYALLDDVHKISHGGGHGQVEVCDLLSKKRELIHVKIYGRSSVLSHLFAQGFVSGQLIQIDAAFRKKVRQKLKPPFQGLLNIAQKPDQDEFTIVYAIISAVEGSLHLPFFSRVNLNNTAKVLKGFGYKVELLKIDMDETFAKTVKGPPGKAKKL